MSSVWSLIDPTDAAISTWLAIGASLQLLGQSVLPTKVTLLVPVLYFVHRLVMMMKDSRSKYKTSYTNVRQGRWTFESAEAEDTTSLCVPSDGVVVFVLGSRIHQ